jgi:hypothetical protein
MLLKMADILSRVRVTNGFRIDNWIYWTLLQLVTTLHRSLTQTMSPVTLVGNGFQRYSFLDFRVPTAPALAGWHLSATAPELS